MVLAASASYGVGWTYVRRFLSGADPGGLSMPTAQVLVAVAQVPLLLLLDRWWGGGGAGGGVLTPAHDVSGWAFWGPVLAVVALGVVGTGLAQAMQYSVVRAAGPTVATSVTYPITVVSVALGVLLLDETIGQLTLVGAVVVLAGSVLITRAGPTRRRRAERHTPGVSPAPVRMER
jgi:drug/metabolite transporter (DMT)-like permease